MSLPKLRVVCPWQSSSLLVDYLAFSFLIFSRMRSHNLLSFLIAVLSPSWCCSLGSLPFVYDTLVSLLGSPKLEPGLQEWPHNCWAGGKDHLKLLATLLLMQAREEYLPGKTRQIKKKKLLSTSIATSLLLVTSSIIYQSIVRMGVSGSDGDEGLWMLKQLWGQWSISPLICRLRATRHHHC